MTLFTKAKINRCHKKALIENAEFDRRKKEADALAGLLIMGATITFNLK